MTIKLDKLRETVTHQIIEMLEKVDVNDYKPPFASLAAQGIPKNPITNHTYQGINILSLWFNQNSKGFSSNEWATFKQWKDKGGKVLKGEKGSRIVFYKTHIQKDKSIDKQEQEHVIPILKSYIVYNANQVDGYQSPSEEEINTDDKVRAIEFVDQFCQHTGAVIRTGENRAYYSKKDDFINMPKTSFFVDTPQADATENYYATLLHELIHWTGAKHRLDRFGSDQKYKITDYAFEELIAELGAAFLCSEFQITQTQPAHHAMYVKSWLKALKNDNKHIFKAAAAASKATGYLEKLSSEVSLS